jgi:hypothetical protein
VNLEAGSGGRRPLGLAELLQLNRASLDSLTDDRGTGRDWLGNGGECLLSAEATTIDHDGQQFLSGTALKGRSFTLRHVANDSSTPLSCGVLLSCCVSLSDQFAVSTFDQAGVALRGLLRSLIKRMEEIDHLRECCRDKNSMCTARASHDCAVIAL